MLAARYLRYGLFRFVGLAAVAGFGLISSSAPGQIYNWQTGQVIPGTQNINLASGIDLSNWDTASQNLEYAEFANVNISQGFLFSCDLTGADFTDATYSGDLYGSTLINANFSGANLSNTDLFQTNLTNAIFANAVIVGDDFGETTGFTSAQFFSTASYQNGNLSGVGFEGYDLTSWNLANQNLTKAVFEGCNLTNVNFTNAIIVGAWITGVTGFTPTQLYSTASYQNGDLGSMDLESDNLTGWNFTNQNMVGCNLSFTNLTITNFTGANVTNVNFRDATGFTASQLYSTVSYQNHDIGAVNFEGIDVTGWEFAGQNLANAEFDSADNADFSNANLTGAYFDGSCSNANFNQANLTGTGIEFSCAGDNFNGANLTNAGLYGDTTNATFAGAIINGATINFATAAQLYSTLSYQRGDLTGAQLGSPSMAGWNFANQNLTNGGLDSDLTGANLANANLTNASLGGIFTNANFTGATITGIILMEGNPFTEAQFDSTASYQNGNLSGISCYYGSFEGWNLAGKNLSGAYFYSTVLDHINLSNADLTGIACGKYVSFVGANFSGANLTDALFGIDAFEAGFPDFCNADFANANLTNVDFESCDLSNADFRGATFFDTGFGQCNLYRANFSGDDFDTGTIFGGAPGFEGEITSMNEADFSGAHVYLPSFASVNPTDVNFAGAFFSGSASGGYYAFVDDDLRGATGWSSSGIIVQNSILPNGTIPSLALGANELLIIRNNPMAIHVSPTATFNATSTLQFWLEGNWTSPMIFDLGVVPSLAGTLDLEFADGVDPSTLVGQTFELFDFIDPLGSWDQFNSITSEPGLVWDTSNLYTDGTVTLMALPEPAAGLLALGAVAVARWRRR